MRCPDCGHSNLEGEETCTSCQALLSPLAVPQPQQGMHKRILEGTVRDLQPHKAGSLAEDATLDGAIRLMREQKMGCVLVIRAGKLAGMLTERDLLVRGDPAADPAKVRVADIMRPDPDSLLEDEPLAYAFHKMTIHGMHHLAVRRSDDTFAVVSARDLLRYLCE